MDDKKKGCPCCNKSRASCTCNKDCKHCTCHRDDHKSFREYLTLCKGELLQFKLRNTGHQSKIVKPQGQVTRLKRGPVCKYCGERTTPQTMKANRGLCNDCYKNEQRLSD